ncbi:sulfate permease, partial [archaeon]
MEVRRSGSDRLSGEQYQHNRLFQEVSVPPPSYLALAGSGVRSLFSVSWRDVSILQWAPKYNRHKLVGDLVAAVNVVVLLLPQSLAYAVLAGVDPIYGLYSSIFPLLMFALLTTSSQVAIGPNAPTSIMTVSMIQGITTALPRSPEFTALQFTLSFVTGLILIILGVFRVGIVASLLSWPVMAGFSSGAAFIIGISQVPDLLQFKTPRENNFFTRLYQVFNHIGETQWKTALIGIPILLILLFGKDVRIRGYSIPKKVPLPLVFVIITIIISASVKLSSYGVAVVGNIPSSLPAPINPIVSVDAVTQLIPSAIMLGLINYVQTITIAVMFGKKVGEHVAPNKELVALGAAGLFGSFFSSHAICGSFTRSAVQNANGAKTPMATAFTGLLLIIAIFSLTHVFKYLPTTVLAAIVISSTRPLIAIEEAKVMWRTKATDFMQIVVTFVAVLAADIQNGLLIGVGFSLLMLLFRTFKPRVVNLGRLADTDVFVSLARYIDANEVPGVKVLRLDGEMHFGNVASITNRLYAILDEAVTAYKARPPTPSTLEGIELIATASAPPAVGGKGTVIDATADTAGGTVGATAPAPGVGAAAAAAATAAA